MASRNKLGNLDRSDPRRVQSTHNNQGKARTQTDGLILKRTYQQMDATKKMAPIMYRSTLVEELLPVSSVSWKEVYVIEVKVRSKYRADNGVNQQLTAESS